MLEIQVLACDRHKYVNWKLMNIHVWLLTHTISTIHFQITAVLKRVKTKESSMSYYKRRRNPQRVDPNDMEQTYQLVSSIEKSRCFYAPAAALSFTHVFMYVQCLVSTQYLQFLLKNHLKFLQIKEIGQRRNLKSRLFNELNQPIDYTPKYTFKC